MTVQVEQRGSVRWITIDRPEARNAVNAGVLHSIGDAIASAETDPAIQAMVLTGAGDRAFCAGGDLREAQADRGAVFDSNDADHPLVALFRIAERSTKPLVARVNGAAMGGGLGLVCMCDLVVASDRAKFGTPEVRIGVFPMVVMSYLLRLIPRRTLAEMALTGLTITAAEAKAIGLVNRVVAAGALDEAVTALLDQIAAGSPQAIALGKSALHAMQDMSLSECFDYSQLMIAKASRSADAAEGLDAFVEGRPPRWGSRHG